MGFFESFTKRVMDAVALGRLERGDRDRLGRMLDNAKKRNAVLARGILSALKAGKASEKDISRFAKLLETANARIAEEKAPFSGSEQKELRVIFLNAGISEKAARWFSFQIDEFLGTEIGEAVREGKTVAYPVAKKTLAVEFPAKKQKLEG